MDYGLVIRVKRNLAKLTLRELGELTGISYGQLGKFERGDEKPSEEALNKIGKVLNISFEEYDKKDQEIEELFVNFRENVLYYRDVNHYLTIVDNDSDYIHCRNYYKVLLMKYVLYVLNGRKEPVLVSIEKVLGCLLDSDADCNQLFHQYIGVKYSTQYKFELAIDYLEKAIAIKYDEAQNALIYYHLGQCCLRNDMVLDALQYFESAKELFLKKSNYKRAFFCDGQLGSVYSRLGQNAKAIKQYQRCINNLHIVENDDNVKSITLSNMSWVLIKSKRYEEALKYIEAAYRINPNKPNNILHYSWCYYALGNYMEAYKWISSGKAMFEKDSLNYRRLELFDELCQARNARKVLQLAIQVFNEISENYDFELKIFYLDIVIEQLLRKDDAKGALRYAIIKINLLENR